MRDRPPRDDGTNRRTTLSGGAIGAPLGAAAAVAGRQLDGAATTNALQHGPSNSLGHEATNALTHQATESAGTEVVAAAAGAGTALVAGGSAAGGAAAAGTVGVTGAASGAAAAIGGATTAAGGATTAAGAAAGAGAAAAGGGAAGGGAAAGGAAAAGAQGQVGAIAIGTVTVAAAATAVVVVVVTSGDDPPPEPEPAPTTVAAPEPLTAAPTPGPSSFEIVASENFTGDLMAGVDQATEAGPIMVAGLQGAPTNIGVPLLLDSGATLTVEPAGTFEYVPGESFVELKAGESMVEEFSYVVTNALGFTEEWTASITVFGENDAPVLEPVDAVTLTEESTSTVAISATDPDGDPLAFTLDEGAPDFVSITDAGDGTAELAVNPAAGAAGAHEVPITVSDDSDPALTASTTLSITVEEKEEEAPPAPARVTENLGALYRFGEDSGASAADSSGSGVAPTLTVGDPSAVTWNGGSLTIDAPTIISSGGPATALTDAIKASNEFTVEAWVTPTNSSQAGPARIVSISSGTDSRNVMLAQGEPDGADGDRWTSRHRSTETSANGLPGLAAPAGSAAADQLTHLVVTRNAEGTVTLYVNGSVAASGTAAGDLSNWDGSLPLVLANETTMDRPWLGTIHLVAVYSQALSAEEVEQNRSVGS